jgi:hypothetical protein
MPRINRVRATLPSDRKLMEVRTLAQLRRLSKAKQAEYLRFASMGYNTRPFLHVNYRGLELTRGAIDYEPKKFDRTKAELSPELKQKLVEVAQTQGPVSSIQVMGLLSVRGSEAEFWGFRVVSIGSDADGTTIRQAVFADAEGNLLEPAK